MDYLCFLCCPVPVYHRKVELILHAGSTWLALAAFAETEPSDSANPAIAENLIQSTGDIRCSFKAASVAAEPCGPPGDGDPFNVNSERVVRLDFNKWCHRATLSIIRSAGWVSTMDVEEWLEGLGLAQYAGAFAENDIDFAILGKLTDADLKDLGISSLGHRKRLLAAIAERGVTAAPSPGHADEPAGERRQVTILFADLCGFTALSRTLDPEEVRELLGRYTALVDGIVVGYGGMVDKHIGDAVMALFGAPRAHDDDPMRAARAALDIHEALGRMSVNTIGPLQAHVGIEMVK
jgi:hypothetical protein